MQVKKVSEEEDRIAAVIGSEGLGFYMKNVDGYSTYYVDASGCKEVTQPGYRSLSEVLDDGGTGRQAVYIGETLEITF